MPENVISNASCLIILDKINELDLLKKVYSQIIITPAVVKEFNKNLPDWINVKTVKDEKYLKYLSILMDIGEASVIALESEYHDSLLIIDDLKARKFAKQAGLQFTGTLGVLFKAKENGIINNIKPLIEKILNTNFRISQNIVNRILERSGE